MPILFLTEITAQLQDHCQPLLTNSYSSHANYQVFCSHCSVAFDELLPNQTRHTEQAKHTHTYNLFSVSVCGGWLIKLLSARVEVDDEKEEWSPAVNFNYPKA